MNEPGFPQSQRLPNTPKLTSSNTRKHTFARVLLGMTEDPLVDEGLRSTACIIMDITGPGTDCVVAQSKNLERRSLNKTTEWNNKASKCNNPGGTWPRLETQERIGTAPCSLKARRYCAPSPQRHMRNMRAHGRSAQRDARSRIKSHRGRRLKCALGHFPEHPTTLQVCSGQCPLPLLKSRSSLKHGDYSPLARLSLCSRFLRADVTAVLPAMVDWRCRHLRAAACLAISPTR